MEHSKCKILAYDIGTGSTKAALVDLQGTLYGTACHDYGIQTPTIGYAEQVPADYWNAVRESTHHLLTHVVTDPGEIVAMVFTAQSMGIIPVDKNGTVLNSNITWVDGRAQAQADRLNQVIGSEIFDGKFVLPKLMWLKEEKPDVYERTYRFLGVNGYLCHRATGKMVAELSNAASYAVDPRTNDWRYELFDAAGIDREKLPEIIGATSKVGTLTKEAARELGLSASVCVYGGCDDVQSAAIGSGAMNDGDAHIYLGSSAWICNCSTDSYETQYGICTTKSADPRLNLVTGVNQSFGMTLDWAIDTLYSNEKKDHPDIFAYLDETVEKVPPGSEGLLATPWLFGETTPFSSETMRAAFINLTSRHTRAHMFHAVCEGLCYNLKWTLELYQSKLGISPERFRVIGGAARDQRFMQMLANILGKELYVPDSARYSGVIGAATCAAVGLGVYESLQDVAGIVRIDRSYLPDHQVKREHDVMYEAFKEVYPALGAVYERLNGGRL